jgi:hypothetical protein
MQTLSGTVMNGVVVLDGGPTLPEGTKVRVEPKPTSAETTETEPEADTPTLAGLLKLAGKLTDMPADFAEQHDHYIHGTPKR